MGAFSPKSQSQSTVLPVLYSNVPTDYRYGVERRATVVRRFNFRPNCEVR